MNTIGQDFGLEQVQAIVGVRRMMTLIISKVIIGEYY